MSPFIIALFMAAGVSAWTYDKSQQRTGGNTSSSATIAAVVAVIVFVVTLTILSITGSYLDK